MTGKSVWAILPIVVIAFVSALLAVSPVFDGLRGLSLDSLTALRWRLISNRHDPSQSPLRWIKISDSFVLRRLRVAFDHQLLDQNRAFDGGDDGGKLQQQPIAHGFGSSRRSRTKRISTRTGYALPLFD
jgi:hypothetical protein